MKNIVAMKLKALAANLDRRALAAAAGVGVTAAASTAGAQSTGNAAGYTSIDYGGMIGAVSTSAASVITANGPVLFGFIATIGGFYFIWGRVRSLW